MMEPWITCDDGGCMGTPKIHSARCRLIRVTAAKEDLEKDKAALDKQVANMKQVLQRVAKMDHAKEHEVAPSKAGCVVCDARTAVGITDGTTPKTGAPEIIDCPNTSEGVCRNCGAKRTEHYVVKCWRDACMDGEPNAIMLFCPNIFILPQEEVVPTRQPVKG